MNGHDLKLGQAIEGAAERDAIHIAVAPVTANEPLSAGQHVGFVESGTDRVGNDAKQLIGVVDPFLSRPLRKGERCWMFLYPNTITGLRHEWAHPSFTNEGVVGVLSASEKWLRDFADATGADYFEMMDVAASHCDPSNKWGGDYLCEGGRWEGQSTPDEFWDHFKNVTGKAPEATTYGRPGIFSCSC